jgi:hypothetical protein
MKWGAYGTGVITATVVAAVRLAAFGAVSAETAAGVLQLLGIGLTVLGVAVVRSWLGELPDTVTEPKRGLDRWWAAQWRRLSRVTRIPRCDHASSPASRYRATPAALATPAAT